MHAMLRRGALAAGLAILGTAPLVAQTPQSPAPTRTEQSPVREREELRREQRRDEAARAAEERARREQAARDSRLRLDQLNRESLHPQPAPPAARDDRPQPPGPQSDTDRAGQIMREDAERRSRLEYDRALRAREDAEQAARGAGGQSGSWRPIGAGRGDR
jgi:hypothetical protein